MSKLYDILKEVIEKEVQIDFDENNHCLILKEEQSEGSKVLKSVCFKLQNDQHTKPKNYTFHFAFKLDDGRYKFLGQLFNARLEDIRKAVDVVLFCEFMGKKYIFLVELKSNERKGFIYKFKSSKLFIKYLALYLSEYYKIDISDFEFRSILFDRKVNTRKTVVVDYQNDEKFYHQGFNKPTNNEADIRNFIK